MTLSFRQLFAILFILFLGLLAATALQAWTGPTGTAPTANVSAPINVSATDQVKNAGLSLNSLGVFGSAYVQNDLGVGRTSPVVALDVNGSIRLANGGEVCQSVTEGTQRYNSGTKTMEYCDGTSWKTFGVTTPPATLSATRTYTSGAIWSKSSNLSYIVVDVYGAGGGGSCSSGVGATGGTSSFSSVSASGGTGGNGWSSAGSGGTGSGGDLDLSGSNGSGWTGGAAAAQGPGTGGAPCYYDPDGEGQGPWGTAGGGGGYAQKTIQAADLSSSIPVTIGAGGGGGYNSVAGYGSAGGAGKVVVKEYTTQ